MEFLTERGVEFDVVEYLKAPLSSAALTELLEILQNQPTELVRRDKHFGDLGLTDADVTDPQQVVETLVTHPRLMQRPVVVHQGKAVIARPPKAVLAQDLGL